MDDDSVDHIFQGKLENLPSVRSKIVRIFTSSTFTDMSMERNALMEDVYPRIKDFCREKHGLEFQVVDMRWGVRDEATDDHMTTDLCMREIENCQRLSMGPNFVTFLGQKYGYRPIPTIIDGNEFRMIRESLAYMNVDVYLLDQWYREDTNSVPSVFILQPISSILVNFNNKRAPKLQATDQSTWWTTLENLQKLLRKAANALYVSNQIDKAAMHNYMMSVTEREVINGILNVSNTKNHCLSYVRQINYVDMTNLREVSKFIDVIGRTVDIEAQRLFTDLRDNRVPAKIEKSNSVKYTVNWNGKEGLSPQYHSEYLQDFTAHFYKKITRLVDRAMRKEDLSSEGHITTEILQHLHAVCNSVKTFQGRDAELEKIKQYLQNSDNRPLILHGKGGCGKTSLLAKASSMVTTWCTSCAKPMLIVRFLGTTPDSSSVIPMLTSVCQQIMYNYNIPWEGIPDDLIPLVAFFKRFLSKITPEQALFLFLDSVDQLSGSSISNKLSWMPTILPPNVKFVISTVSEEKCEELLFIKRIIQIENQFIEVYPLGPELAEETIKSWLNTEGRGLNKYQWKVTRRAISKCTLPIFIKLIFADVIRWKSYSKPTETILAYTVNDSIMKLFDRIETQHGKTLVCHALSYITAAKCGLSETELEDMISMDDIVLDDVYQYHMPPIRRIPPLLWTRIRRDLPNYLSERDADGVSVLNWYHRQFRETAIERYFDKPGMAKYFHSSLAEYFLGTWGGGTPKPFRYTEVQRHRFGLSDKEGSADRKVPLQPHVFYASDGKIARYNKRKLDELPFHFIRSLRFNDLYKHVLFSYSWLHSKIAGCPVQAVLSDFEDAMEHIDDNEIVKQLIIISDALRLGGVVLGEYPDMLGPQITARLLPVKVIYPRVAELIALCDEEGPKDCALIPGFHCLHTPGGPLKYSLEGHQFAVFGFVLTCDHRFVVSVSNIFLMFDLCTGDIVRNINPEIMGIMQSIVMSKDDKYAAAYTNYNEVIILNVLTGDVKKIQAPSEAKSICGIGITNEIVYSWTDVGWRTYRLIDSTEIETKTIDSINVSLLVLHYFDSENYSMAFSKCNEHGEEETRFLRTVSHGVTFVDFPLIGGLFFKSDEEIYLDMLHEEDLKICNCVKNEKEWKICKMQDMNMSDSVIAVDYLGEYQHVLAIFKASFALCNELSETIVNFHLPYNVRNISTKPFQSQSSLTVTRNNQYAIGAVRKLLYVWSVKDGQLLKEVEAHFARILKVRSLYIDEFNGVITSSIDRTLKVWNVQNIFEKVHIIDRMEMAIDSVALSREDVAVTVTRNSVGVWSVSTGRLWNKLVDNPVGAIVTHATITKDAQYVISAESGFILVWYLRKESVVAREKHPNLKQLTLTNNDSHFIVITTQDEQNAECTVRCLPTAELVYRIVFVYLVLNPLAITNDNKFLVLVSKGPKTTCLLIYEYEKGKFLHSLEIEPRLLIGFSQIQAFPGKDTAVSVTGSESTAIFDVDGRKMVRNIYGWNGSCTSDGKHGLVAPARGGLELVELRHGKTAKVLLPPINEGVFNVVAKFTSSDLHVLYYHGGKRTIRLFRVSDGKLLANYRLPADAGDFVSTHDGFSVVIGGIDGSFVVLSIVDGNIQETIGKLKELPSRTDSNSLSFKPSLRFKAVAKAAAKGAFAKRQASNDNVTNSNVCALS